MTNQPERAGQGGLGSGLGAAVIEFVIPREGALLLTPNVRNRTHWAVSGRASKEQREAAAFRAMAVGRGLRATGRRAIEFTLVRGKGERMVDTDALGSCCKPYLDGIVDAGLLVDDSPKWCVPTYLQLRGPNPSLRVRITEAEG